MEELLERTAHADVNELIDIVDELRHIEHELGLVSEDAMEAFEMEDEEIKTLVSRPLKPLVSWVKRMRGAWWADGVHFMSTRLWPLL